MPKKGGVVVDAIHSLHMFGYAHLDVRLENICFSTASPHHAILIDLDRCSPVTKPAYFQERYYPSSTMYKSCDKGGGKEVIEKPQIIDDYNCFMGCVEVVHQHLVYYAIGRKGLTLWRREFYPLLEMAIVNSYAIYKLNCPEKVLTHKAFHSELARSLCEPWLLGHADPTSSHIPLRGRIPFSSSYSLEWKTLAIKSTGMTTMLCVCKDCHSNPHRKFATTSEHAKMLTQAVAEV